MVKDVCMAIIYMILLSIGVTLDTYYLGKLSSTVKLMDFGHCIRQIRLRGLVGNVDCPLGRLLTNEVIADALRFLLQNRLRHTHKS